MTKNGMMAAGIQGLIMKKIEVFGLGTIPKIKQGDNLAEIIIPAPEKEIAGLQKNDIVVLTSKIVSKARAECEKCSTLSQAERRSISLKRPARMPSGSR